MSLPVLLNLRDLPVLVAGCGAGAARALFALVEAGARVTLAAGDNLPKEVEILIRQRQIRRLPRPLRKTDLTRFRLVFAAEDRVAANRKVLAWARGAKAWGCCLPGGGKGEVSLMGSIRRSGVLVAFADAEARPGLGVFLRRRLQRALPRWLQQARRAAPRLSRRLIRGWGSVARNPG